MLATRRWYTFHSRIWYIISIPSTPIKTTIEIPETTMDRLAEYIEFHIESRYPDENREFYNKCSKGFTILKYNEIEEVYNWLTKKLEM